eukprot:TRINITY_DN3590_c1_g1_i1.p1 TRINITY_DN3590_c1_g1~~TRINITY_DN3590_c1_g1_i1.p1  ORF type:complete len:745 (+),score=182.30 TRINITY_DN3590_c1_g1_i1:57-2291(+)
MADQTHGADEHIRVFLRIRPPLAPPPQQQAQPPGSPSSPSPPLPPPSPGTVNVAGVELPFEWSRHRIRLRQRQYRDVAKSQDGYRFEHIFGPSENTSDVYGAVAPSVVGCLDGISATVMAYGQTAAGKTHTVAGGSGELGIAQLAVGELMQRARDRPDIAYSWAASYYEVHNERVYDLTPARQSTVATPRGDADLRVCDAGKGTRAEGLAVHEITCTHDAELLLRRGNEARHRAATLLNEQSSRSHAIFQVEVRGRDATGRQTYARLCICDLAGSEHAGRAGTQGDSLREGGAINKSLLALRNVIHALAAGASHVPWRDSKLTRLLQGALGGGARASIVCCIAPDAGEEAVSTLQFGERASTISSAIRVNESACAPGERVVPVDLVRQLIQQWDEDVRAFEEREYALLAKCDVAVRGAVHQAAHDLEAEAALWSTLEHRSQTQVGSLMQELAMQRAQHAADRSVWDRERRKLSAEIHQLRCHSASGAAAATKAAEPSVDDRMDLDGEDGDVARALVVDDDSLRSTKAVPTPIDSPAAQKALLQKHAHHQKRMNELRDQIDGYRMALLPAEHTERPARAPLAVIPISNSSPKPPTAPDGIRKAAATPPRPGVPSTTPLVLRQASHSAAQPRRACDFSPSGKPPGGARRRARTPSTPQRMVSARVAGQSPQSRRTPVQHRRGAAAPTSASKQRTYHTPPSRHGRQQDTLPAPPPATGLRSRRREEMAPSSRTPQAAKRRRTQSRVI